MSAGYREDLAYIHDAGFGQLAVHAAGVAVDALRAAGHRRGLVVDLGCGSGVAAKALCEAGYDVLGIDLSAALVDTARRRVPAATFRVGSCLSAEIPPCVAVTAIGEVFNYAFDPANGPEARQALFGRVGRALAPGGVFLFDMADPDRAPEGPQRVGTDGDDWAVLMEAHASDDRRELTRRITTFRRVGTLYRRDEETHRLHLVPRADVHAGLERAGFRATSGHTYGALALPPGLVAFVARPANDEAV